MTAPAITREAWLHNAIEALRPLYVEVGLPIPEKIHISIGFSFGAKAEGRIVQGQCWSKRASADGVNTIFISPEVGDPIKVLMILVHELVHAADDCKSGHKGEFLRVMKELGMRKPFTDSIASEELLVDLEWISRNLGAYPHSAFLGRQIREEQRRINKGIDNDIRRLVEVNGNEEGDRITSGPPPQTARMLKFTDVTKGCPYKDYLVRTSAKWAAMGSPKCPAGCDLVAE